MAFRMNRNDCKVLESLAEYRILTPTQIAALHQRSRQVVWRRLRILEEQGLVQPTTHEFGRGRGRPERSLGLTEMGVDTLKEKILQITGTAHFDPKTPVAFTTRQQNLLKQLINAKSKQQAHSAITELLNGPPRV